MKVGFKLRLLAAALLAGLAAPIQAEQKLIYGVFFDGCDNTCHGFIDGLKEGGLDAEVLVRDFHRDASLLPSFVEEARTLQPDLVVTYGTPATLGMAGTLDDVGNPSVLQDIPVVFMVVADPFGANIARDFDGTGRSNVAGTFNRAPESVNIEVIRAYDPSFDTLGLLYNSDELNSALKEKELEELAETMDFRLVAIEMAPEGGAPDPARIPEAMAELRAQGVRWLYLGSSSFLRSNGEAFTEAAVENGIAVVSPYEDLVREHHALLSIAADLYDVGKLAAGQALRILRDGATPGDLPIVSATDFGYVVNMEVARRLDRFPPIEFMQVAQTVN
jgi:putative ABC transport system substrate-binding protein